MMYCDAQHHAVTLYVCDTVCVLRIILGGERNALYPVLSARWRRRLSHALNDPSCSLICL